MLKETGDFVENLKKEGIVTWFDIGLFLDALKEERKVKKLNVNNFDQFKKKVCKNIAFINYDFGIDGVTVEAIKYAKSIKKIYKDSEIHWISGYISNSLSYFKSVKKYVLPEINGFEKWGDPYYKMFHTKLNRGDENYNSLSITIWNQALSIIEKLLKYFKKHKITSMVTTNICSNPGNLSLTLAIVIISEKFGIPVVNSNHDFYFENGKSRRKRGEKKGARDHFFMNHDIGEVFSLVQVLYPWSSRNWVHMNINTIQRDKIIELKGVTPSNVMLSTTSIDLNKYKKLSTDENKKIKHRLNNLFKTQGNYFQIEGYNRASKDYSKPFIIGSKSDKGKNIFDNCLLFLQPTRIIKRKRIERDISFFAELFNNIKMCKYLDENKNKQLILLISGPVGLGGHEYFSELINHINLLYKNIPQKYYKRVKFAFTIGELKDESAKITSSSVRISEIYEIADFVLFPSLTEGRGLPIIESSASYTPIFSARYSPKRVYRDLIGEDLRSSERIRVINFPESEEYSEIINELVSLITNNKKYDIIVNHNRKAVEKRFTEKNLIIDFDDAYFRLYNSTQIKKEYHREARIALKKTIASKTTNLNELTYTKKRKYLPGFNPTKYLFYLKTIIDPSFFRVEEAEMRGEVYNFAKKLIDYTVSGYSKKIEFFNIIEEIFNVAEGEDKIITDFSFEFRHRNRIHLLCQELTQQELFGCVINIYKKVFGHDYDPFESIRKEAARILIDQIRMEGKLTWKQKIKALALQIPINNKVRHKKLIKRKSLFKEVKTSMYEDEKFISEVIDNPRHIMVLPTGIGGIAVDLAFLAQDLITHWRGKSGNNFSVTFAVKEHFFGYNTIKKEVLELLNLSYFSKLKKYKEQGLFELITTGSKSAGTNLTQVNDTFKEKVIWLKKHNGILISKGESNYATLDCIDIDTFRLGKVENKLSSKINGFSLRKLFLQFIPAGFRPTYSYPVPIYRAYKFSKILNSSKFKELLYKNKNLFNELKHEMDENGSSLTYAINKRINPKKYETGYCSYKLINGIYRDGNPYNGTLVKLDITKARKKNKKVKLKFVPAKDNYETVLSMSNKVKHKVMIAWNGGYILNNELVGKLLLPESYIGTPLGLIIKDGEILSVPLFNKPAFGICQDGTIIIDRVSLDMAGSIRTGMAKPIVWQKSDINKDPINRELTVLDLRYKDNAINCKDKVVLRLTGNTIIDIVKNKDKCKVAPAGLTIVLSKDFYQENYSKYAKNTKVKFSLELKDRWTNVIDAVEAGPTLVKDGKIDIDMKKEYWTSEKSIKTQASRLDYTNMRCPKIGVGVTKKGNILVIAINARIRESVGATYQDIAKILINNGAINAMGFDPGGSTSVIANGKQVNIPPYNPGFERDIYQGKPFPRKVANCIVGYIE